MDVSHLLDGLNDAQRQAVAAPLGAALILAGAGSGKTRVLVHRVAWLIEVEGASPHSILAVTFTNKAAAEMRRRIETLLGHPGGALWIGTFHGLAHRLLRLHWREAGLPQSFQILDSEDQARLLRKVLKALDLDETRWVPREILWFINAQKDEGIRPKHMKDDGDPTRRQMITIYQAYEEACRRGGVVDFAELLLRAYELWQNNPALLQHYRTRFRHVLIDEFQDTNAIQYKWLTLLAGPSGFPFAVGDDDQSIYRWRGARVENLNKFRRDYPQAALHKLEQNYRSTGNILKAANALIAHNAGRLGKTLWTSGADGERVKLYAAFNERDEADFVVNRIREWVDRGGARSEVAVLYRSNAQSRVFEEAFLNARMPYRVYGGLRFFERAEIKDALAYLRLVASRGDDTSFERVVNLPARGIGAKTLDLLRDTARAQGTSLWMAAAHAVETGLAQRAGAALRGFMLIVEKLAAETRGLELYEQVDHVVQSSGLIEHYKKEKGERGEGRVENLLELVSAARGFSPEGETDMQPLESFLAHAVLESGEGQADAYTDCVQMMTLHSAKGLEFPVVFLAGMEDGLFPHQRSAADLAALEEERRLCYVGATRAMQQLYITYAEQRRLYGVDQYGQPSRFIHELPPELVEEIRPRL
jgi:DNA helicase-2/ATP-dependent DNA helicase PcrA